MHILDTTKLGVCLIVALSPTVLFAQPDVGVSLGVPRPVLRSYDQDFTGTEGERFKERVLWAAQAVDINPGLLAATLIAETRPRNYLGGQVHSFVTGVDDYYEKRHDIRRRVPSADRVRWKLHGTNVNETGREVTTIMFPSGEQALLASAVYLKHGEEVLRAQAAKQGEDFDALKLATKFMLTRMAFHAGHGAAKKELTKAMAGNDILRRKGPLSPADKSWGPRRAATVRTAQAIHLSMTVFEHLLRPTD